MTTVLVKRLERDAKLASAATPPDAWPAGLMREAAARITELEAEVASLTAALAEEQADTAFAEALYRQRIDELEADIGRLFAREAKAREEEREACHDAVHERLARYPEYDRARIEALAAIRARSQS